MARRLLPRQILFAQFCLSEASATQAAIRAGYSPRSARNQAHRLLANDDIRRRIVGGVAALRDWDTARRQRVLDRLEGLFDAALASGRLDAALGALRAESALSGLLLRLRPSPAQRVQSRELGANEAELSALNAPSSRL